TSTRAAPAGANETERAQSGPAPAPAAATPAPAPPLTVAGAQGVMDRADDPRIGYLNEARRPLSKGQNPCRGEAASEQKGGFFPEEMRAFVASLGIGPWSENFCREVALINSDIEKNLYMSVPPFYFPGLTEPLEPNEVCNRTSSSNPNFSMWALYQDYQ